MFAIIMTPAALACDWEAKGPEIVSAMQSGAGIDAIYNECLPSIQDAFPGSAFSADNYRAIFATVAAYSAKPYGGSQALYLDDLLAEDAIDCDNYALLTQYIYQALGGAGRLYIIGWTRGAFSGTHAQLYQQAGFDGVELILDPTVAAVAVLGWPDMVAGEPASITASFRWRTELGWYANRVNNAFAGGQSLENVLYFTTAEQYRTLPGSSMWPTPGALWLAGEYAPQ